MLRTYTHDEQPHEMNRVILQHNKKDYYYYTRTRTGIPTILGYDKEPYQSFRLVFSQKVYPLRCSAR